MPAGENAGEMENGYTWRTSVRRYDAGAQPLEGVALPVDLYQVEVTVNWDNTATAPRTLRFVTLRAVAAPKP